MANLVKIESTSSEQDNEDKVPPLRWHHPTSIPSTATKALHIKRALRWLSSKKIKSLRRRKRLLAGSSAHKRGKDEWDIIREAGKISVEHRSVEEQLHRTLFSSSLTAINSIKVL